MAMEILAKASLYFPTRCNCTAYNRMIFSHHIINTAQQDHLSKDSVSSFTIIFSITLNSSGPSCSNGRQCYPNKLSFAVIIIRITIIVPVTIIIINLITLFVA